MQRAAAWGDRPSLGKTGRASAPGAPLRRPPHKKRRGPITERRSAPRSQFGAGIGQAWGKKPAQKGRLAVQAAVLEQQHKVAQRREAERPAVRELDASSEEAIANSSDMQLVFFGTSAQRPTKNRSAPAVALRKGKSNWLFDCGEDTQRQLLKQALVRPGKIDRFFVTRASGDAAFGLPGMMCICSAAREVGMDTSDLPLHIYGPPGLAEYLRTFLAVSDTYIVMPIVVHEFVTHAVPEDELDRPEELEKRCCLFRMRVPPDQLNPQGYYDGQIVQLTKRHQQRRRRRKGPDERAILTEQRLPESGDPTRSDVAPEDMTWTVRCDEYFTVSAASLAQQPLSFGYLVRESDRAGTLNVAACEEHGVIPGKDYARVKAGESVISRTGAIVRPEQVVGPTIVGRSVAILGEAGCSTTKQWAAGCDLLLHPASSQVSRGCAEAAGELAKEIAARHLVLTGFPETQAIAEAATSIREEDNEREDEDEAERSWWDSPAESQPDAANRQSAPRGQRHVNAALGRLRAGVFRDPFAERCVEAAAERFGADAVSAAADLMVLSVERRWGPA
ncbi:g10834 [Coccomyxa elongata]